MNARSFEFETQSVEQTQALGKALARLLRGGDVIALVGELGAGKTQLVRGLAQGLGVDPKLVASPTFVLVHEYPTRNNDLTLVHVDAYRLTSLGEIESIGWDGSTGTREFTDHAIVVIEWADRLADLSEDDTLWLELEHAGEQHRRITARAGKAWAKRIEALTTRRLASSSPPPSSEGGVGGGCVSNNTSPMNKKTTPPPAPPLRGEGSQIKPATPHPNILSGTRTSATSCPICEKPVTPNTPHFPFCSHRCRTIDLGKWISGDYKVSRAIEESDLDEGE
ncbi:MAG: tRNA (adenosine(37)-N6)-threonylcarbamoyltransferase complex ATPase subunit type 1 TsaE [Phycisphaera sp.]|nr:tRNA (adenosine(37)-N6)-threonylcarbamoyltransferase complex ATPase subunit type 1 TsaE [Phycisphaera sp.]